jgi:hypothetical protein
VNGKSDSRRAAHRVRKRGRPPVHREKWSKVSVVLFDRQIIQIDRFKQKIAGASGWRPNRATIIRAVLDAVFDCSTPPCGVTSEAGLRKDLAKHLASLNR